MHGEHPRRLGLLGGESSGKTTLARELVNVLDGCLVEEALRDFVDRHHRPPRQEEQAALLAEQVAREEAVARTCARALLVADPAPLMTAVYSLLYFADESLLAPALDHARGYGLLVWCAPDFPWATDAGQRDGPDHRAQADAIIATIVTEHLQPSGIPVIRAVGDTAARVTSVRLAWQPDPLQGLT